MENLQIYCPECEELDSVASLDPLGERMICTSCQYEGNAAEFEIDRRISILAHHLDVSICEIVEDDYIDNHYTVSPATKRRGASPTHYKELAEEIRGYLEEGGINAETWQELNETYGEGYDNFIIDGAWDNAVKVSAKYKGTILDQGEPNVTKEMLETQKRLYPLSSYIYLRLKDLLPEGEEGNRHRLANGLHSLLTEGEYTQYDWHTRAIRAGFNGEDIDDDRESYETSFGEFLVLTDSEADEKAEEYIRESLWAFNSSFLAGETNMPESIFSKLSELCEDANEPILALVEKTCGLADLVDSATSADGRGHFISFYDGEENEVYEEITGEYIYIYQTN